MGIKGYKGFDKNLKCRGFQYEVGKTYELDKNEKLEICECGFHFCKKLLWIHEFYELVDSDTRVCEVEALGEVQEKEIKCVTDKIKIIRELSKEEIELLKNDGIGNTGVGNTGYRNTGDRNTGDWNKTNRSAGVFCNKEPKLMMFNKPTDMTFEEWRNSEAYDILWRKKKSVWFEDMTDAEKKKYPSAETCGGYLKEIEYGKSSKEWWKSLEDYEKKTIFQLPNFDLDIFNDIMALKVTKKEYKRIMGES